MKKLAHILMALVFFLITTNTTEALTLTEQGNIQVSASVIGLKPVVYLFDPTEGDNSADRSVDIIVGRNFTNAGIVTLNPGVILLTGTIVVHTGCTNLDATTTADCNNGGSYDKITGLSIPSGTTPGVYDILVTTPNGTNNSSDTKYTVLAPTPTSDATIISISESPFRIISGQTKSITLEASDDDDDFIYYHVTELGGTWDVGTSTGTINTPEPTDTGEVTLQFNAGIPGYYQNVFSVYDVNTLPGIYDDTRDVWFVVQTPEF